MPFHIVEDTTIVLYSTFSLYPCYFGHKQSFLLEKTFCRKNLAMSRTILVTGATGNQGGAVLESLVERIEDGSNNDIVIIALTRNATSPTAKRLAARSNSIRVLQGNMDDPDSVLSNAKEIAGTPVWSVFMVQVSLPSSASNVRP